MPSVELVILYHKTHKKAILKHASQSSWGFLEKSKTFLQIL